MAGWNPVGALATQLVVVASLGSVAGCVRPDVGPEPAGGEQQIIGGMTALGDEAVVMVLIGGALCSGTLVAPNVVLTAAHCVGDAGPHVGSGYVAFGQNVDDVVAERLVSAMYVHRYYQVGLYEGFDIALLRLAGEAPAGIEPIPLSELELTADHVGAAVRSVGFGIDNASSRSGAGIKRQIDYAIAAVAPKLVDAGDLYTGGTCSGDSGGPLFMEIRGTEHVIGVTSFGAFSCDGIGHNTRVDVYTRSFLYPIIDAWSGPCKLDGACVTTDCRTPDPDCDPCGYDGTCAAGCPTKDLDCPVGGYEGDACSADEECEELVCAEAPEDPRVKFCSRVCDPALNGYECRQPLGRCMADGERHICAYEDVTPSVQGASCITDGQCRAGICDPRGHICVEPCAGDCPDGFSCADLDGTEVCRLPEDSGGCRAAGKTDTHWLIGILLVGLLSARRRKRRST